MISLKTVRFFEPVAVSAKRPETFIRVNSANPPISYIKLHENFIFIHSENVTTVAPLSNVSFFETVSEPAIVEFGGQDPNAKKAIATSKGSKGTKKKSRASVG
tara:strand:- start:1727 stop:2035 length:309 start_codon:yes stop_codon:yes gene_type:complete